MSVIKHKEQRIAILIDVQNMYHSAKNLYKAKVNFKEILKTASAGRKLVRAIAYVIKTEGGEESAFFGALTKIGLETKTKDLQIFPGGFKKGDWDVGITIDAVQISDKIDALILVTGDGDFIPLVKYIQAKAVQVELIAFSESASAKLIEAVDDFVDLSKDAGKYLFN